MQGLSYVLVTAARNEAEHIGKTITAVASQTICPQRWILVSDGSTDDTDAIVEHYSHVHPWITLLRVNNGPEHSFRKKARAQNAGYEALKEFPFEAIGFLDGDTSVPPDLFEYLLAKFVEDPSLGAAGVPYVVGGDDMASRRSYDQRQVSGACQLFRRECFEQIGRFIELEAGGEDTVAIVLARMNGWRTRSFLGRRLIVHKAVGFGDKRRTLHDKFLFGYRNYVLGNSFIWEVGRGLYQMTRRPYVSGGFFLLMGYMYALVSRARSGVPAPVRMQVRQEQHRRIRTLLFQRDSIG